MPPLCASAARLAGPPTRPLPHSNRPTLAVFATIERRPGQAWALPTPRSADVTAHAMHSHDAAVAANGAQPRCRFGRRPRSPHPRQPERAIGPPSTNRGRPQSHSRAPHALRSHADTARHRRRPQQLRDWRARAAHHRRRLSLHSPAVPCEPALRIDGATRKTLRRRRRCRPGTAARHPPRRLALTPSAAWRVRAAPRRRGA